MQRVDIMEEDAKASVSWRQMSTVATPIWAAQRHKNKEKEQVKEEYMICWGFFVFYNLIKRFLLDNWIIFRPNGSYGKILFYLGHVLAFIWHERGG